MSNMSSTVKAASVLVPILPDDDGHHVLFTVRSQDLKHHPGQIGFPGGAVEAMDASSQAAALRESFEEVGLDTSAVTLLFDLPVQYTSTHYQVTPWVGLIQDFTPQLNEEVASLFKVPLSLLLEPETYQQNRWAIAAKSSHIYQFYWGDTLVWGVTASICHTLCEARVKLKPHLRG